MSEAVQGGTAHGSLRWQLPAGGKSAGCGAPQAQAAGTHSLQACPAACSCRLLPAPCRPHRLQRFLTENGLRLVLRSHEGPDAREGREDGMQPMGEGWTLDHDTPAGKLMTIFRCAGAGASEGLAAAGRGRVGGTTAAVRLKNIPFPRCRFGWPRCRC